MSLLVTGLKRGGIPLRTSQKGSKLAETSRKRRNMGLYPRVLRVLTVLMVLVPQGPEPPFNRKPGITTFNLF